MDLTAPGLGQGVCETRFDPDIAYWLASRPTIADIRALNRDSWATWPLSFLIATTEAGVSHDLHREATARVVGSIGEVVDVVWLIEFRGQCIAELGCDSTGFYDNWSRAFVDGGGI